MDAAGLYISKSVCHSPHLTRGTPVHPTVSSRLISSGARRAFDLRGPYDILNLAILFGLESGDAKKAITSRPREVLARAAARRSARGMLTACIAPPAMAAEWAASAAAAAAAAAKAAAAHNAATELANPRATDFMELDSTGHGQGAREDRGAQ